RPADRRAPRRHGRAPPEALRPGRRLHAARAMARLDLRRPGVACRVGAHRGAPHLGARARRDHVLAPVTMRTSSIAVLGIAAYAIFLAATIPARFVAQRLASPGEVEISEARGTLWSGSARATIFAGAAPLAIDRIRWRFQPARLASARLAF